MPVTDIKPHFLKPLSVPLFEKIEVVDCDITAKEYNSKYSIFKNVNFKCLVSFKEVNFSHGIQFENSEFFEAVVFENAVVDQYDQLFTPDSESIVFKNCKFSSIVRFFGKRTNIQRSLVFDNCCFDGGLEIEYINIEFEGLKIYDCTISKKLDIFHSSFNQDIRFSNNKINSFCRLTNNLCSSIVFSQANAVCGHLNVDSCKCKQGIVFNDGIFKEDIYFSLNETKDSGLTIIDSTFEKAFIINYHSNNVNPNLGISKFYIGSSKFSNGFHVMGVQDLFADCPIVNEIYLNISSMLIGSITFNDLDIGILSLNGYNAVTKITFKHIQVNQLKIKGLINEGGLIFSGMTASLNDWFDSKTPHLSRSSAIYIDDTNLGKAQFFQTNLSSFDKIVFSNIILTEISTSHVVWFTKEQLEDERTSFFKTTFIEAKKTRDQLRIENARKALISNLNSKKEIYRQLKFASQKQGDIPLSLHFQSLEMNYYYQIIKYGRTKDWSEYLILLTNKSNDYGQNWIKPFILLLFFSFLTYLPIGFLTSKELNYSRMATSIKDLEFNLQVVFCDNIRSWIVLLIPTHRIKDINEKVDEFSKWVYFWDIISRIVISYFIFQVVNAFRKFSK